MALNEGAPGRPRRRVYLSESERKLARWYLTDPAFADDRWELWLYGIQDHDVAAAAAEAGGPKPEDVTTEVRRPLSARYFVEPRGALEYAHRFSDRWPRGC
jgi:hypothetical protein